MPNLHRFERTPGDGRFIVVSDIYPTPTTAMADLILPAAAWVEREGVFGNTERRTQQWNKMVDPPGEAREDAWQIIEVAKRMGMGHLFPWPDDNWHEPMFEEYRPFGLGHGKDLASLRSSSSRRAACSGRSSTARRRRYRYAAGYDPYVKKASGVHFYKAKGYGEKAAFWLRPYHPPAEVTRRRVPVLAVTGRVLEHWHTGLDDPSRARSSTRRCPTAYVELNRADAERVGRQERRPGARSSSRRGRARAAGRDRRPRPAAARDRCSCRSSTRSLLINLLTLDAMDNISKQPDYKKCAVRVERV